MFPTMAHDGGPDPEGASARLQVRRLLEEAIDALPEPFRLVLVARDVEGMSVEEAAEVLGLRPGTVRTRLHRARRLLRAALEARLGDALRGAFPFEGAHCSRLAEAVLARLGAPGGRRGPGERRGRAGGTLGRGCSDARHLGALPVGGRRHHLWFALGLGTPDARWSDRPGRRCTRPRSSGAAAAQAVGRVLRADRSRG